MLANGVGKTRANRFGGSRPAAEWRTLILSTGEVALADKMSEDTRTSPVAAGQKIRIIDLEADAGFGMGVFEDLHGHPSPAAFAVNLKDCAESNYGHAGPEFVARIAQDVPTAVLKTDDLMVQFILKYRPEGKIDGQIERVIRKFALVAAAGEMAISYGVVPWQKGTAMSAAGRCFQGWLDDRGTTGSLEDDEAVKHVREYIQQHGPTRFFDSEIGEDVPVLDIKVQNRVGFIRTGEGGREYCFFCERWENDLCKGKNHKAVARALLDRQYLVTGNGRRLNKSVRMNGNA